MFETPRLAGRGEALARLRFPPPSQRVFPTPLAQVAIFLMLTIGGLIVGVVVVSRLLDAAPIEGPGGLVGFVIYGGIMCTLAAVLALVVFRVRNFRVRDGMMTLVMPRRTISGKRIRHVPLQEIAFAERIVEPGTDPGIWVVLRDGTRFPIFEGELPRGGHNFLDELAEAVNRRHSTLPSDATQGRL